jgi:cbb3-type cytochrome oxidase maturation protein
VSVIFLLILISLFVAVCFLGAFLWAVRDGQYEDDYSPSVRILFDDGTMTSNKSKDLPISQNNLKVNKSNSIIDK